MLIHKACCYLVLISILLLPNCLLLLLLFTVSINFSMYPQHLHRGMVHYVMFLREGWLVIECDFKPLNDHDGQLPLLLLLLLWLWWLSLLLLLFCISKCFLWMKMMYCTSLIFSVPQKDFIRDTFTLIFTSCLRSLQMQRYSLLLQTLLVYLTMDFINVAQ